MPAGPTQYSNTSVSLSSSSPGTIFMNTQEELSVLFMCVEGFLYGKISVLCDLVCTLVKEVQLFPGLGIYSGIFVIYLQCRSQEPRTTSIVFYTLCLLYLLSTATVVSDLLHQIITVSNNFINNNIIFLSVMQMRLTTSPVLIDVQSILFRLVIVQTTVNGCCDFIAQCILVRINHCTYHLFYSLKSSQIYRCWIVWGKNTRVVILPSFLAITYIGQ